MRTNLTTFLVTALLAVAGATAHAVVRPHTKTIVVESPEDLPALAQPDGEAMYLYDTYDGRSFLYVEAPHGQQLIVLDVTDPAQIRRIAQTSIPTTSSFDFVRSVGDESALIRYRNGSGIAVISFKHYKHPVLVNSSAFETADSSETLGQTALLVTSTQVTIHSFTEPRTYRVVDTSNPSRPVTLWTIPDVKQRLAKSDTGTLFLLNRDGVTVVRRLRIEDEHSWKQCASFYSTTP
jgi:hypothetical protein